ncbi:MAG: hypothetical protein R3E10_00110 [Gemmatimonadota bacterium]
MTRTRAIWNAALLGFLLGVGPQALDAQVVRVSGASQVHFVNIRPLELDSVPVGETLGSGIVRRTADGQVVRCVTGEASCRFLRSVDAVSTFPFVQDVTVSAWGFGQGVRVYAQLRGRGVVSEEASIWPQADDRFDALVAFAEIERPRLRVRGGRQFKTSGLGFYNFDGGSVLFRPRSDVSVEAYGGWSLLRGLNEPVTSDAVSAIESLAPDARGLLVGGQVGYRPSPRLAVTALYQRELRDDRAGLYSERVSTDAVLRSERGTLDGALTYDLASGVLNDARLSARTRLPRNWGARAFARHYRPYFDLWTIWGAFSPVSYDEVGAAGAWADPGSGRSFEVQFSRRGYGDADASTAFGVTRSDGWRASLGATLPLAPLWMLSGSYGADIGYGAAKTQGQARVQRTLGEVGWLGVSATAFQRIFEFRINEGRVYGAGVDGRYELGERTSVSGSFSVYRHDAGVDSPEVDWNQMRGSLRVDWTLGAEPARRARE